LAERKIRRRMKLQKLQWVIWYCCSWVAIVYCLYAMVASPDFKTVILWLGACNGFTYAVDQASDKLDKIKETQNAK
jgi:hypothetical protein